ncbi:MAG: hypothetical protein ABI321_10940 [Polyangia bacterium]
MAALIVNDLRSPAPTVLTNLELVIGIARHDALFEKHSQSSNGSLTHASAGRWLYFCRLAAQAHGRPADRRRPLLTDRAATDLFLTL